MNSAGNTAIPTTNPATGITTNPVGVHTEGTHLHGQPGVLQNQIQQGVLDQHASALRGQDVPLSSAFLIQGAPIGTGHFPNTGTGFPNPGVPQTGAGVPVGVTNHAGLPVGVTGYNQPATGGTGLAGVSQATAAGIPQGNVNKSVIANTEGMIQTNVLPNHTNPGNTTAQGQFTFRPLEGRFVKDKDPIGKMDCYVKVKVGWHTAKSAPAQGQGVNPVWTDAITLPRKHNETFAKLAIKDKDRVSKNDRLGAVKINLDEVVQKGRLQTWYPVATRAGEPRGEILVDIEYLPLFIK